MGYLFLALALGAGITKAYCGKRLGNATEKMADAVSVNLFRMVLCIIIGFVLILVKGDFDYILPNAGALVIMAVSGVATSVFLVTWLLSVNRGVYLLVEVFLMLGVLVPILTSAFWFGETVSWAQWVGIGLLFLATVIMCSYNNTQKKKLDVVSMGLLILCGLSNGLADFMQKLFVQTAPEIPVSVFNFYTYVFSSVTLLPMLLAVTAKAKGSALGNFGRIVKKSGWLITIMAVCLFMNSYFKTVAAGYLEAAQLYPLNQGASLILSALMATVIFKEKFTVKTFLGILAALSAILVMNLL